MIRDIGFDGFFSGEIHAKDFEKLSSFKRGTESFDLFQETSHSTIPGSSSIWNTAAGEDYVDVLKVNIDNCFMLSIPILVIHIQPNLADGASLEIGLKRLKGIVKHAKERGVKIAFENINSAEYLYRTLDFFDDSHVGFCYDCGHEACHTNGEHFLPNIGERLFCTHIHDNDTRADLHLIPFDGQIDFNRIAKELRDCGYTGNITLELCYNDHYKNRLSKYDFLEKSFDTATTLQKLLSQ